MPDALFSPIEMLWNAWVNLFTPLPYGNPYIAGLVLVTILTILARICWTLIHREIDTPEMERLRTYRRVMNLN